MLAREQAAKLAAVAEDLLGLGMYSVREIAQVCDEQAFDAANASGEQDQPLRVLDSQRFHRAMYVPAVCVCV